MIFIIVFLITVFIVALFTRYINPDTVLCYSMLRARLGQVVGGGAMQPIYELKHQVVILQDWIFRAGNINEPSIKGETAIDLNNMLTIQNGQDQLFYVGKVIFDATEPSAYTVLIQPDDQAVFQVFRSIIPYYYGWKIMSRGPVFRHFRYYSLKIRQAGGATLQAKWKFTTYRLPAGTWVGDHLGLHGEGLLRLDIRPEK